MNALSISSRPMGAAMRRDWLLSLGLHAALWGGVLALSAWLPGVQPPLQRLEVALAWAPPTPALPAAVAAPTPMPASPAPSARRREPPSRPAALPQPAPASRQPETESLATTPDVRVSSDAAEKIASYVDPSVAKGNFDTSSARAGQGATAAPASVTPPQATNEQSYQQWRALLGQLLEQHKRYPASARRMGQSGVVVLHLRLDAEGGLQHCSVQESSGFKALDQAAEQLLRTVVAALRTQVQPGRTADLHVPIVYELKEV